MSTRRKVNSIFKNFKKFFLNISNLQIILITYLVVVLLGTCFLLLPISQKPGVNISFIDILFTVASAFSDTGLTTRVTVETWTDFGQAIIAILILVGGIGIFALKVWIINVIFRKSISITSRNILEKERSSSKTSDLKKTIKISVTFLFVTILVATFILWLIFYFEKGNFILQEISNREGTIKVRDFSQYDPHGDVLLSFKAAVFHSISAINNAGFDILSDASLSPYYGVYSIQIVFIILLIIGGIGFPVIYDVLQYISHKIRKRTDFHFSLFTKISCVSYLLVFLVGLILTFIFELTNSNPTNLWNNNNPELGSKGDRIMCMVFHVFSTRNAGFTTLDTNITTFLDSTLIIFAIMMFIGSAPSSTAGGIRTTTLAIIIVAIWNRIRGINEVRMFKRKISQDNVFSSFIVLAISILIILLSSLICFTSLDTMWGSASSKELTFADIFYDICSAFGTTGLSTGLTSSLNTGSKLTLILTMFIGQLGISSTILVWRKNNFKNNYSYIEEDIIIG